MGMTTALDLAASGVDLRVQLSYHLSANHYPPVPKEMVQVCLDAIDLANEGEWEARVSLPDGATYRGETTAPVWAVVEGHHLFAWIDEGV